MTIDVYPAHEENQTFSHADNWDDGSTMNMSNAQFYKYFTPLMGLENVPADVGHWKTKTVADALRYCNRDMQVNYTAKLAQIVARAQILKAEYICYG